ncbi:SprT family zinc-dependent metalloprotease [Mycoplasmatota bacterium WC44]
MRDNIQIIRKKVKNFNLRIKPNLEVVLSVPLYVSDKQINDFLSQKEKWITEKIEYLSKLNLPVKQKEYVDGELILYLGDEFVLEIVKSSKNHCIVHDKIIVLYIKDKDDFKKKEATINNFYKNKAKELFEELLVNTLELFNEKNNITFQVRKMKSIWGSCNKSKRKITLNTNLMMQHKSFIEYVIAHEVAHLKHANHSKDFYNWLALYMPDWKERKNKSIRSF